MSADLRMHTPLDFTNSGREIELWVDGEWKRLGYIKEMSTSTDYDEFRTVWGEANRIPRETRTNLEVLLWNADALRMFTEIVQRLRINDTVMFVIVKSWDMSVGVYENVLKLDMVITDTVDTSETYEIPGEVEKLAREDHSFREELL